MDAPGPSSPNATDSIGPSSLINHARPYRSRVTRPCDRCRKRKQRCVVMEGASRCLNCELSATGCEYILPPPPEKRPRGNKKPAHTLQSNAPPTSSSHPPPALGVASGSDTSYGTVLASSRPPSFQRADSDLRARPPSTSELSSSIVSYPVDLPPPPPSSGRLNITNLLYNVTNANAAAHTTERPQYATHPPVEAGYRALDLDAGEDTELYLVGTVAERDAITLSILATSAAGQAYNQEPPSKDVEDPSKVSIPAPGLRVRQVAQDVSFVKYRTKPYEEDEDRTSALDSLALLIQPGPDTDLMQSYMQNDGLAIPIWSRDHFQADPNINEGLQCALLTTGMGYHPTLRVHMREAWSITSTYFRTHGVRARLSTIQAGLLDLHGRLAVNPAGNFLTLNKLVAVAKLLGLNRDCSLWTIPLWERELRTRLWWALVQYDKLSAFTFGRQTMISDEDFDVPLPRPGLSDSASYDSFLSTCELSLIMGQLKRGWSAREGPTQRLDVISQLGVRLELWRRGVDERGLFEGEKLEAPGVQCLQLAYHYSVMALAGEALDAIGSSTPSVVAAGQRATLTSASDLVTFLMCLKDRDFRGFWSPHSSMFLSTCLTILVRLTLFSDREDQTDDAIWQGAVLNLRRLLNTLTEAQKKYDWDIASLALSRAAYFVPLLQDQIPELSVVLQPLQEQFFDPPATIDFQSFLDSFAVDPLAGLPSDFIDFPLDFATDEVTPSSDVSLS